MIHHCETRKVWQNMKILSQGANKLFISFTKAAELSEFFIFSLEKNPKFFKLKIDFIY